MIVGNFFGWSLTFRKSQRSLLNAFEIPPSASVASTCCPFSTLFPWLVSGSGSNSWTCSRRELFLQLAPFFTLGETPDFTLRLIPTTATRPRPEDPVIHTKQGWAASSVVVGSRGARARDWPRADCWGPWRCTTTLVGATRRHTASYGANGVRGRATLVTNVLPTAIVSRPKVNAGHAALSNWT